jgi:hypothetical protein
MRHRRPSKFENCNSNLEIRHSALVHWQKLFPNEDYRFHLGLRPGDPARFFQPMDPTGSLLAERQHWLAESTVNDHAALLPDGAQALDETIDLATTWNSVSPTTSADFAPDRCTTLGRHWEPDFILLHLTAGQPLRLVGGVVCFPSGWALPDKLGQNISAIHAVVPQLNETLDRRIDAFFARFQPGTAWERENWGLAASPDLNRHPKRNLPPLDAAAKLHTTWLRIEHQIFFRLPISGAVLFGIRVEVAPLLDVARNPSIAHALARALQTMPDDIATYKGIKSARASLLEDLRTLPPVQC